MDYVILRKYGGVYAALVKNKKYGDGGNSSYSTNLNLEGVSLFNSQEKAKAAISAIERRRPHPYKFYIYSFNDAKKLLNSNDYIWCIGKLVIQNEGKTRDVYYLLNNNNFGEKSDPNILLFKTEEEAENKKKNLESSGSSSSNEKSKLLVLYFINED